MMISICFAALPLLPSLGLVCFLLLSGISLLVCCYDKYSAQKGDLPRIPEKTLWLLAAFGGALAMYLSMRLIRHKTLHKNFMLGLPLMILAHFILLILALFL
ncbi:MAG: DUF1294 domain-containing protein [Bacillota bacterium]|nr:DUF1294 domain-containing protein [Bacillota bacterium]